MGFFAGGIYLFNLPGCLGSQRFLSELPMSFDVSPLGFLAIIAFGLLIAVTGGIAYLTAAEWRDRRRQEKEKRKQ
jgi:hypothetical protein